MRVLALAVAALAVAAARGAAAQRETTGASANKFLGNDVALDSACSFSFADKTAGLLIEQAATLGEMHAKGIRSIQHDGLGCSKDVDVTNCEAYSLDLDDGTSAFCPSGLGVGVIATAAGDDGVALTNSNARLEGRIVIALLQPVSHIDVHLVNTQDTKLEATLYLAGQRVGVVLPEDDPDDHDGVSRLSAPTPDGLFDRIILHLGDSRTCLLAVALPCSAQQREQALGRKRHAPAPDAHYHYRYGANRKGTDGDGGGHDRGFDAPNTFNGGVPSFSFDFTPSASLATQVERCVTDMMQFDFGSVWEQSPTRLPNNRGVAALSIVGELGRPNGVVLMDIPIGAEHDSDGGQRQRAFCMVGENAGAIVPLRAGVFTLADDIADHYMRIDFTHPIADVRVELLAALTTFTFEFWLGGSKVGSVTTQDVSGNNRGVFTLSAGAGLFDELRISNAELDEYHFCLRAVEIIGCDSLLFDHERFESEYFYYPLQEHTWKA